MITNSQKTNQMEKQSRMNRRKRKKRNQSQPLHLASISSRKIQNPPLKSLNLFLVGIKQKEQLPLKLTLYLGKSTHRNKRQVVLRRPRYFKRRALSFRNHPSQEKDLQNYLRTAKVTYFLNNSSASQEIQQHRLDLNYITQSLNLFELVDFVVSSSFFDLFLAISSLAIFSIDLKNYTDFSLPCFTSFFSPSPFF